MAYQLNNKLDGSSYNSMINRLKVVYGDDDLTKSYGQLTLASGDKLLPVDVSAGELVTADQWNKLYEMVERCATHQGTEIGATLPSPISTGGVSSTDVVQFYSELETAISNIEDNSFNVDPEQLVTTTDGDSQIAQTSTRSRSWSNSISYAVSATPNGAEPSVRAPGWFFNAGSEFIITLNYTGTNANWTTLSSNYNTIVVDNTVFDYSNDGIRINFFSETEGNDTYNVYYTLQTDTLLFEIEMVNSDSEVVTGEFKVFIDESRAVDVNAVTVAKPSYSSNVSLNDGGEPIRSIVLTRVNASVPSCEISGDDTDCIASFAENAWHVDVAGTKDGETFTILWQVDGGVQSTTLDVPGEDSEIIRINSPEITFLGNETAQLHTMTASIDTTDSEATDSVNFIADHSESSFTIGNITETVIPVSCDLGVTNPCSMTSTFSVTPSGGSGSYTYGWSANGNVTGGVSTNSTYDVTSNNSDETTAFDVNVDVFDTFGNDGNAVLTDIEHVRLSSPLTVSDITETVVPPSCDLGVTTPCSMSSTFSVTASGGSGSYTYGWSANGNVTGGVSTNSTFVVTSNNSDETTVFDVNVDVSDTFGADSNTVLTDIEHIRVTNTPVLGEITISRQLGAIGTCDLYPSGTCVSTTTYEVNTPSGAVGAVNYIWSVTGDTDNNTTLLPQGDHCDVQMTHTSMTGDRTYTVSCSAEDTETGLIVNDSFDSYQEVTDSSPAEIILFDPAMGETYTSSSGEGSGEQGTFEYILSTTQWSIVQSAPGGFVVGSPLTGSWLTDGVASDYQVKFTYELTDGSPQIIHNHASDWTAVTGTLSFKCGNTTRAIQGLNLTVSIRKGTDDSTIVTDTCEVLVEEII